MPWLLKATRHILKNIDNDVEESGIQKMLQNVFQKCDAKLTIDIPSETKDALRNQPVLIVANHPAEADPLVVIASLPKRKDVNLIVNSSFLKFGNNIDKHLIPVYISHRLKGRRNWKFKFFKKTWGISVYPKDMEHQKNIESIKKASEKISKGELVILFPMGGSNNNRWFSGVGHLIKDVKTKDKSLVVMAYVEGTSNKDYLRLIPGLGKLFSGFKITFSNPISLENFDDKDAKTTTVNLEKNYNDWAETLEKRENKTIINFFPQFYLKGSLLLRTIFFWFITK